MGTRVIVTALALGSAAVTAGVVSAAAVRTDPTELTGAALIMGGTFLPTMPPDLVTRVMDEYVDYLHPGRYGDVVALTTPEEFSGQSYRDGAQILANAIAAHSGDDLLVFGVSQSAGIEGMLLNSGVDADPDLLRFVALAPPTWPDHGVFEGPNHDLMTALFGSDVTAPFPVNSDFGVDVYCGEYDPICDFPTNTWNLLADWNALMALGTVHGGYVNLASSEIDAAVPVDMGGSVNFWTIPTEHLPMLYGLWDTPFEQWLDPILRPLIDAAYDTPTHGLDVVDAAADIVNLG